tara:strand:- start:86 stop:1099 length:1014 start_codon:yes stop_codon:yes gene_type:complete
MLHNHKFKHLLQTVFCDIYVQEIDDKLNELFSTHVYEINNLLHNKRPTKTNMETIFCAGGALKAVSVKRDNEGDIKKTSPITQCLSATHNIPPPPHDSDDTIRRPPVINDSVYKFSNTDIIITPPTETNHIIDRLVKSNSDYYIKEYPKTGDYLSMCVFSILSRVFNISRNDEKNHLLKNIKMNIIALFNKENYYKHYDYSVKYFKKSDAEHIFANNLPITPNMLKIYGDILNVNMVYIMNDNITFINKFNSHNATIIIVEFNNKVIALCSNEGYIRGECCGDILGVNKVFVEKDLKKLKLDKIQNIAKMKNINIKKAGKTGKINVSIPELIELITK